MKVGQKDMFYPSNRDEWRQWLLVNHKTASSVWVVFYRKNTGKPTISWEESVEEALCFGWIDSTKKRLDDERFIQFFTKRKPNSTWSKINKLKIQELNNAGLMTQAGIDSVNIAKENGSWIILDSVEDLIVPDDLKIALESNPKAKDFYFNLSASKQKGILAWLVFAKRADTRFRRVNEVISNANKNQLPKGMQ